MSIKKDGNNIILSAEPNKVIFADLKNKQACKNYANCISGTFQYTDKVCSILVAGGKVINNSAAHAWLGYPDSCLIYYKAGNFTVKRLTAISAAELPKVQWAISGVGLLDKYNPAVEGYARFNQGGKTYDYSDVLRKTNHTVIGVKSGQVYGLYLVNMNGVEVNEYCKKQGLQYAVMLDGGHVAAVNSDVGQVNGSQKQSNIIQFVQETKPEGGKKMKVCIDAGHGGADPGAVGQNGALEKDITLQIALQVKAALLRNGVDVVMTRESDKEGRLVIAERCKIANDAKVDYLVSIHANADGDRSDKTGYGTETWAYSKTSAGYSLAQTVQKELVDATGLTDRGVKFNDWAILKGVKAPAILVETAFINNTQEEKLLTNASWQKKVAEAIAKAIVQYCGLVWMPEPEQQYNLKVIAVDGSETLYQIEQENRNGTVWAPIRQVAEVLGCKVEYDTDKMCVVVRR